MAQLTHELETFDVATPELSSSPPIYLIPPFPSISPPAPTFHISTPPLISLFLSPSLPISILPNSHISQPPLSICLPSTHISNPLLRYPYPFLPYLYLPSHSSLLPIILKTLWSLMNMLQNTFYHFFMRV